MKTPALSVQHGLITQQGGSVEQSQTSTNQKRRWGKRAWDRTETISVRCFWVMASICMVIMLVGFCRVWAFGHDCKFRPKWYDQPALWVLTQVGSESPTIDPDTRMLNNLDID